jgi:hypothetical protein
MLILPIELYIDLCVYTLRQKYTAVLNGWGSVWIDRDTLELWKIIRLTQS